MALLFACAEPEVEVVPDEGPRRPEVVTEGSPGERNAQAAPTLASSLEAGQCATQDDCGAGEVCVALSPGHAECRPAEGQRVPGRAPNGRPAPPIGLLDGQMMREHAGNAR